LNSRLHGFMLPLTAPQYTKPDRFESFLDARRWYVVGGAKSEARCAQNANLIKPTLLSCGTMSQEGNTMRTSTRVMTSVPYDLPQLCIMTARLRPPPPPKAAVSARAYHGRQHSSVTLPLVRLWPTSALRLWRSTIWARGIH